MRSFFKRLETDTALQFKIHRFMAYFWVCNAALVVLAFFFLPDVWKQASVLYLVLVSLYANLATDYGAVSSAIAAQEANKP